MEELDVSKGIIYYSASKIEDPIKSKVRELLVASGLPITSATREKTDFGTNVVIAGEYGYPTMVRQIISALSSSSAKYVFFCEDDVLYPVSHFDFTPPQDNVFYYNCNAWRWLFGTDTAIKHDRMLSLSCMCVNRLFALSHYLKREETIRERGWDKIEPNNKEPSWARKMGYEPGQKKKKRGGFSDDDYDTFSSTVPVIDIRHKGTFSPPKTKLSDFKHPPKWFEEVSISSLPGWDLKEMFNGS